MCLFDYVVWLRLIISGSFFDALWQNLFSVIFLSPRYPKLLEPFIVHVLDSSGQQPPASVDGSKVLSDACGSSKTENSSEIVTEQNLKKILISCFVELNQVDPNIISEPSQYCYQLLQPSSCVAVVAEFLRRRQAELSSCIHCYIGTSGQLVRCCSFFQLCVAAPNRHHGTPDMVFYGALRSFF